MTYFAHLSFIIIYFLLVTAPILFVLLRQINKINAEISRLKERLKDNEENTNRLNEFNYILLKELNKDSQEKDKT